MARGSWTPTFARDIHHLFGNGSGEELSDYVQQHGLTYDEAQTLIALLSKVDTREKKKEVDLNGK